MNPRNAFNGVSMKLLVYSDLHLDLSPFRPQLDPEILKSVDTVVLAGDTTEGTGGLRWARETFPGKPIIYVDGNHEFYSQHWDKHIDVMRKLAQDHEVHYLENDTVLIGGVRFLGCTLWTDYALHGADEKLMAMSTARQRMSDYPQIKITRPPSSCCAPAAVPNGNAPRWYPCSRCSTSSWRRLSAPLPTPSPRAG